MTKPTARLAVSAVAAIGLVSLAACSKSSTSAPSSGKPVYGGTLRVIANGGPDHLDTVQAYIISDYVLERTYARQLVSYPTIPVTSTSGATWQKAITVVPDVAAEVPSTANGGITGHGLVYT